ncbi:MAG: efflux RND transporter periplasmic adaptor subunit [Verrucomicrobiales bacterium]|nr:efflux RND transporter periplasmic adaptor subunit [Verrucomicrobiales bacterium]
MSILHEKLSSIRQADRSDASPSFRPKARRDQLAAVLPFGLVVGFAALLWLVMGDRLMPARELQMESVATLPGGTAYEGVAMADGTTPLFQASGWVEPDPLPVKATALVDGVVEEVLVLEGESVKKGQLLATLIDDDAVLNLRTAESRLASLNALADAQKRQAAIIGAEIATLKKRVAVAGAKRAELEDQVKRFDSLLSGQAVAEREVALARLQLGTQEAEIEALVISEQELEEKLAQQEAIGRDYEARIAEAETEVDRRRLELDRTRIVSPLDGIVLRLMAVPGEKRMLGMDHADSSTIAILYQPDRLQARIDVPLAEAGKLAVGQAVRLQSSLLPERVFHGRVTRIVGEADLQRNTLQAKVRIEDPDPRLRPEMLCRAEFLAPVLPSEGMTGGAKPAGSVVRLFVPEQALTKLDGSRATIWRLDATGDRVEPGQVTLGEESQDGYRLVVEGLRPGDRVVIDPPQDLEPGERVRPKP